MSDPLDDFNRRITYGDSLGPPTNAAESAAQSFIDTQRRSSSPVGGGSVDFGAKISVALLLIGIVLFFIGSYFVSNFQEGPALMGIVVSLISGFLILIGTGGFVVASIRNIGGVAKFLGMRNLLFVAVSGLVAYWISPTIWSLLWKMGLPMPIWFIALTSACLIFILIHRFFRTKQSELE